MVVVNIHVLACVVLIGAQQQQMEAEAMAKISSVKEKKAIKMGIIQRYEEGSSSWRYKCDNKRDVQAIGLDINKIISVLSFLKQLYVDSFKLHFV
jgi:hypothetical protein